MGLVSDLVLVCTFLGGFYSGMAFSENKALHPIHNPFRVVC